jgi:hypothetical protein
MQIYFICRVLYVRSRRKLRISFYLNQTCQFRVHKCSWRRKYSKKDYTCSFIYPPPSLCKWNPLEMFFLYFYTFLASSNISTQHVNLYTYILFKTWYRKKGLFSVVREVNPLTSNVLHNRSRNRVLLQRLQCSSFRLAQQVMVVKNPKLGVLNFNLYNLTFWRSHEYLKNV